MVTVGMKSAYHIQDHLKIELTATIRFRTDITGRHSERGKGGRTSTIVRVWSQVRGYLARDLCVPHVICQETHGSMSDRCERRPAPCKADGYVLPGPPAPDRTRSIGSSGPVID
eukprot:1192916-Prorocentrum_minimum.AAC.3